MAAIFGTQTFPKFDALHAHCGIQAVYEASSCLEVFNHMKDTMELWAPEPKAKGSYKIWNATEEEYLWFTRTTPSAKFVDDIDFQFFGNPADFQAKGCTVKARSRSQSLSYYDYDTNYCNMWNVFQNNKEQATYGASDCKWVPKDAATQCAKY